MNMMLEAIVRAVEAVERWMRSRAAEPRTDCVRVHTATGDVLVKLRLPVG